jgi:hypothetical protein
MRRYNIVQDKHAVSYLQTPSFQGVYRMLLKEIPTLPDPPMPKEKLQLSPKRMDSPKKRKTLPPVSTIYNNDVRDKSKSERMFKKNCQKLRTLWNDTEAPQEECEIFASLYFGIANKESLAIVTQEMNKWADVQKYRQEIFRAVDARESLLDTLRTLASKYGTHLQQSKASNVSREVKNLIVSLRYATLETVESIMRWRVCIC